VPGAGVRILVVRDVIDMVLVDKCLIDDPRRLGHNLVDPAAVTDTLAPVRLHGASALARG
jgi:hypothetical protein